MTLDRVHAKPSGADESAARCPFAKLFGRRAVDSLADELKRRTAAAHHAAEHHALQQSVVRGAISPGGYAPYASRLWHLHRALESSVDRACRAEGRLGKVMVERYRRAARFPEDLAALGLEVQPIEAVHSIALCSMTEWFETHARAKPIALLGVLYVLEGSTNGGMVIARVLRRAWNLQGEDSLRSIDPHGAHTREHWQAFRSSLDSLSLTFDERELVVSASEWTFELITEFMNESLAEAPPIALAAGSAAATGSGLPA